MPYESQITVGELKKLLNKYPEDMGVYFGGLDFSAIETSDNDQIVFMWGARSVYEDENGRIIAENN